MSKQSAIHQSVVAHSHRWRTVDIPEYPFDINPVLPLWCFTETGKFPICIRDVRSGSYHEVHEAADSLTVRNTASVLVGYHLESTIGCFCFLHGVSNGLAVAHAESIHDLLHVCLLGEPQFLLFPVAGDFESEEHLCLTQNPSYRRNHSACSSSTGFVTFLVDDTFSTPKGRLHSLLADSWNWE